ncbi:MAG TPA: DNA-directed RNA polymerase subunit A', partial [Euryarchaeota archaeon]|nr:DNA-directed RNA polymerase subunit A' [Euryarchaeota archaeon]
PVHILDNFAQIFSGARGSFANIKNLMGVQGQAAVREKRPHRGFYQRVTSHFKRGDIGPFARGFARSNLRDGLTVNELFFWGMGGRMGEVDKGVSTQITGYYYRRLSNAMMDLLAFPDGTVREVTRDTIVQFAFGDDNLNPQKLRHGEVPLDVLYDEIKAGEKR